MNWYYYLHTNGDLIGKNPACTDVRDFAESDFVKSVWLVDTTDRLDAWLLAIEALARGANVERISKLATKWGLNESDLVEFIRRHKPTEEQKDGLDKFIRLVLQEKPNDFWDKISGKEA